MGPEQQLLLFLARDSSRPGHHWWVTPGGGLQVGESFEEAASRELQGLSQNELAQRTGISQATISAIENDRVKLGVERAKMLAQALKCHPGVLVFPGWVVPTEAAA